MSLKSVGTSLGGYTIFELSAYFLSIFGLHGYNILNPIMKLVLSVTSLENLALFEQGVTLQNIFTKNLLIMFILVVLEQYYHLFT